MVVGREILQSGSGSDVTIPLIISNLNNTNYNWFELTLFYAPSVTSAIDWDFSNDNGSTYNAGAAYSSSSLRVNVDNWQIWFIGSSIPLKLNGLLNANFGSQITFKWSRPIYNVLDVVSLDFETKQQTSGVGGQLTKGVITTSDPLMPTNFRFTNSTGTGTNSYQYQVVGYNLPQ